MNKLDEQINQCCGTRIQVFDDVLILRTAQTDVKLTL